MEPNRAIFRTEAMRRYVEGKEKSVLPRLVRPRTFLCLWLLLGLILLGSMIAWLARVPVYASGMAVVADAEGNLLFSGENDTVVVLVPADNRARLQVGQKLFIQWPDRGAPLSGSIVAIEADAQSPAAVQKRFGPWATQALSGPVIVVKARQESSQPNWSAADHLGSMGQVEIQVGSRRVLALVPGVGPLFHD